MNFPKPKIVYILEKKMVGKCMKMNLKGDRTAELWRSFMPHHSEIQSSVNADFISLRHYFEPFNPGNLVQTFEKWAAKEVHQIHNVSDKWQSFIIPEGMYAVFSYKGLNTDPSIFIYIYSDWISHSIYEIADRPHFEILGYKYKNNDPESEEDIYIPIRHKSILFV